MLLVIGSYLTGIFTGIGILIGDIRLVLIMDMQPDPDPKQVLVMPHMDTRVHGAP